MVVDKSRVILGEILTCFDRQILISIFVFEFMTVQNDQAVCGLSSDKNVVILSIQPVVI